MSRESDIATGWWPPTLMPRSSAIWIVIARSTAFDALTRGYSSCRFIDSERPYYRNGHA
jgi:hypothetical protein